MVYGIGNIVIENYGNDNKWIGGTMCDIILVSNVVHNLFYVKCAGERVSTAL